MASNLFVVNRSSTFTLELLATDGAYDCRELAQARAILGNWRTLLTVLGACHLMCEHLHDIHTVDVTFGAILVLRLSDLMLDHSFMSPELSEAVFISALDHID